MNDSFSALLFSVSLSCQLPRSFFVAISLVSSCSVQHDPPCSKHSPLRWTGSSGTPSTFALSAHFRHFQVDHKPEVPQRIQSAKITRSRISLVHNQNESFESRVSLSILRPLIRGGGKNGTAPPDQDLNKASYSTQIKDYHVGSPHGPPALRVGSSSEPGSAQEGVSPLARLPAP